MLGTVTDPTGAAAPKAAIAVTNTESGVGSRTESNAEGACQVACLMPGVYTLEVTHPGFRSHKRGPNELRVDDRARIDVALEIGRVSEQVTVTAATPLVEETTATRGPVITSDQITSLPLHGHHP